MSFSRKALVCSDVYQARFAFLPHSVHSILSAIAASLSRNYVSKFYEKTRANGTNCVREHSCGLVKCRTHLTQHSEFGLCARDS